MKATGAVHILNIVGLLYLHMKCSGKRSNDIKLFNIIYSHKKNKKNNADTSFQARRQEKHNVSWL
jgi:hypothetical protein